MVTLSNPSDRTLQAAFTGAAEADTAYYEIHVHSATISDAAVTAATYRHPLLVRHTGAVTHTVQINTTSAGTTLLTRGSTYYVRIASVDLIGNRSAGSTEVSQAVGDATAPGLATGITLSNPSDRTLRITFTGAAASDTAYYEIHIHTAAPTDTEVTDATYRHPLVVRHTGEVSHSQDINTTSAGTTLLTRGTTYHVRLVSVDQIGNRSAGTTSASQAVGDATAPPVPTGLTVTDSGSGTLSFTFTGTTDAMVGTDYYEIHIHSATISDAAVTAATYRHVLTVRHTGAVSHTAEISTESNGTTDLTNQLYYIRIAAVDLNGNRSDGSTEASAQPTGAPPAPSNAIAGHVSAVTATTLTVKLDAIPSSNVTHWAVDYRVRNPSSPNTWTQTTASSTLTIGTTIVISNLTEGTMYDLAMLVLNSSKESDHGTLMMVTPTVGANTWDGSQITDQILTLIDDNLTGTLALTRKTQYGTLRDYPNIRDQSAVLPIVLVELQRVDYQWRQLPTTFTVLYRYRIVYLQEYASTDTIVRDRVDKVGHLVGLFIDNTQLAFSGGVTTQGQVKMVRPTNIEIRPIEDNVRGHGELFAAALDLEVECSARK